MKTSEFIEKVEGLGFKATRTMFLWNRDNITIAGEDGALAIVSEYGEYIVDTNFEGFRDMKVEDRHELMSLILEYTQTPINEREEERKWHLIFDHPLVHPSGSYLNINSRGVGFFSTRQDEDGSQTVFTDSEIEKMDINGLKKVAYEN